MDDSVPLVVWIVVLSGLTVFVVFGVLLGAMLVHQRRLADEAARWGRHLLEALDGERDRIASELHDGAVPRLLATRMAVEQHGLDDETGRLNDVIAELRGMAHELHPPALRHLDLANALADLGEDMTKGDGPDIAVKVPETSPQLDAPTSLALYRIAQEAVMNAMRHAAATTIELTLAASPNEVTLTIRDDGKGVADPAVLGAGFGTRSMRERAKQLGGTLDIESAAGRGTTVRCRVAC